MSNIRLNIAIPSNLLEDCGDLRSKTLKIGQIARAAAIFKIEKIIIYSINKDYYNKFFKDMELIKKILEYLDCPQYLRKLMFLKLPIFKYVGALPPLRTPHHPLENKISKLEKISIRDGTVIFSNNSYSELEIGVETPIRMQVPNLPLKTRVTVKLIKDRNSILATPIKRETIKDYWGYQVQIFKAPLQTFRANFESSAIIATSKKGNPINLEINPVLQKLCEKKEILLLFGSPNLGLFEIFRGEGLDLRDLVDSVINIAPNQGTQTIRVEEAIYFTLAIISFLRNI